MATEDCDGRQVVDLICSQDDAEGNSKSTSSTAKDLTISERSVTVTLMIDLTCLVFLQLRKQKLNRKCESLTNCA